MKKIGIDARLFGTGHGGIGRYTQKLIEYLEKIDDKNQYIVFLQKSNYDAYQPKNKNFKKVLADYKVYGVGEQIVFPFLLKKHHLDLMYFAHFNVPILYNGDFVVTIHDLIISHYPTSRATTLNPFVYKLKLWAYKMVVNHAGRKAQKIIAVSEFTKQDIVKRLRVRADKIKVIYEGADLPAHESGESKEDYLLYVGSAYPHKNLEKLLVAFDSLSQKYDGKLILVGKQDYFYEKLKSFAKKNIKAVDKIVFFGYADDHDLHRLYRQARAYVFPSLIEGFGLPVLEAQSYNLPIACANTASLPEVAGQGAVFFDPDNIEDMAEKMSQVLSDEDLRQKLIDHGRENIKRFSWEKMAKEVLGVLERL